MKFTEATTKEYYEHFSDVYEAVWNEEIHTGFFDTEKSLAQAVQDMDVFLAKEGGVKKGMTILTAGSGRGGTDRYLVKTFQTRIIGLDLSPKQIKFAKERARAAGLEKQISYVEGSMTHIPLEKETVDMVWAQESFFHVHDKERAVQEFFRVLKPGGLVLLEETHLKEQSAKEEVLASLGARAKLSEILMIDAYRHLFQQHGFIIEKMVDISIHLEKTYAAIVDFIRRNKEHLRVHIPDVYREALDRDLGFFKSFELVRDGKLGCSVMLFRKNV